jgi:hypothetical protein
MASNGLKMHKIRYLFIYLFFFNSVLYRGGGVDTIVGAENPSPSQFCPVQVSDSCVATFYRLTFQVSVPQIVLQVPYLMNH